LPELLVEELEITQQFEMEIETNKIRIRTIGSIYNNSNAQTEQPSILSLFGSPLSSAIACSLAKSTGNPVIRIGSKTELEEKLLIEEYLILQNQE
jgi:hypothetical protein